MEDGDSLVSETALTFSELPLDLLGEQWLNEAWNNKYIDIPNPEIDFENECDVRELSERYSLACCLCKQWTLRSAFEDFSVENSTAGSNISNASADQTNLWTTLLDNGLQCKNLLGLLYAGITQGSVSKARVVDKKMALYSAQLYFALLLVPGSTAYGVFQQSLFQHAVQCLKLPTKRSDHSGNAGGKRSRRTRSTQSEDHDDQEVASDNESEMSEDAFQEYMECLTVTVRSLLEILKEFSLRSDPELTDCVIHQLCELTQLEVPDISISFVVDLERHASKKSPHYLPMYAFWGLKLICEQLHGDREQLFKEVVKNLMPNILMLRAGNSQTIPKPLVTIKDNTANFIIHMMSHIGEQSFLSVLILMQHLSVQVIDKADFRAKTAQVIVSLVNHFPEDFFDRSVKFFEKLALSTYSNQRVFALEVIPHLLLCDRILPYKTRLLQTMMKRCNDKVSSVRSKALSVLAAVTNEPSFLWLPYLRSSGHGDTERNSENDGNASMEDTIEDFEIVLNMLRLRVADLKVHVRKTALNVLENLVCASGMAVQDDCIKLIKECCFDQAVLVRKQALQSMTRSLIAHSIEESVCLDWIEGVFPVLMDPEMSVQEKASDMVEQIILQPLVEGGNQDLTWRVLSMLTKGRLMEFHKYFQKAVSYWLKAGKIRPSIVRHLERHVDGPNDAAAWLLLAKFSQYCDISKADFVLHRWNQCISGHFSVPSSVLENILQVLKVVISSLPPQKVKELKADLNQLVHNNNFPVELIPKSFDLIMKLIVLDSPSARVGEKQKSEWLTANLQECTTQLSDMLFNSSQKERQFPEDEIIHSLVLLGEIIQEMNCEIPSEVYSLIQSCVALPHASDKDAETRSVKSTQSTYKEELITTTKIRAYAFITLGKLCFHDEDYSKKVVPALAKELDQSDSIVIKGNLLVILSDLSSLYAVIVDPFIPVMAACLKDPTPSLRYKTFSLLLQLLQGDFIKIKGALLYHLLSMLTDENESIRNLATYGLGNMLPKRHPQMYYQHFIESVFHFNAFLDHPVYNKFNQTEKELSLFSLAGPENTCKRMTIYKFMLDHMTDEEKLNLSADICRDILGTCVEEKTPLDIMCPSIVKDAFSVLCCEEIKLQTLTAPTQDDPEEDLAAALVETAKKNIISKVVKMHVIENIVPIIMSLRQKFKLDKSVLQHDLMLYFRELMKDYKNELNDILCVDKQLAREIELDIRQLEHKEKEKVKEKAGNGTSKKSNPGPIPLIEAIIASAKKVKEDALKRTSNIEFSNMDQEEASGSKDTPTERTELPSKDQMEKVDEYMNPDARKDVPPDQLSDLHHIKMCIEQREDNIRESSASHVEAHKTLDDIIMEVCRDIASTTVEEKIEEHEKELEAGDNLPEANILDRGETLDGLTFQDSQKWNDAGEPSVNLPEPNKEGQSCCVSMSECDLSESGDCASEDNGLKQDTPSSESSSILSSNKRCEGNNSCKEIVEDMDFEVNVQDCGQALGCERSLKNKKCESSTSTEHKLHSCALNKQCETECTRDSSAGEIAETNISQGSTREKTFSHRSKNSSKVDIRSTIKAVNRKRTKDNSWKDDSDSFLTQGIGLNVNLKSAQVLLQPVDKEIIKYTKKQPVVYVNRLPEDRSDSASDTSSHISNCETNETAIKSSLFSDQILDDIPESSHKVNKKDKFQDDKLTGKSLAVCLDRLSDETLKKYCKSVLGDSQLEEIVQNDSELSVGTAADKENVQQFDQRSVGSEDSFYQADLKSPVVKLKRLKQV